MDGIWNSTVGIGVVMDNKNVLNIGAIIAEINLGAAGKFIQEKLPNQGKDKSDDADAVEYEDRGPIGDYSFTYQDIRMILDNVEQKWGTDDTDSNLLNPYYQRDLLYLYDRISMDMNYLNGYPERNEEWLGKLLELKYEIRNML